MANHRIISSLAGSVLIVSALTSAPVLARNSGYYNDYPAQYDNYNRNNGQYDDRYDNRYDDRGDGYRNARGDNCRKGTTGLILGAVAGGLLGRAIVGRRGDRTAGTIIGAGAGALAGRAVDRSGNRRC